MKPELRRALEMGHEMGHQIRQGASGREGGRRDSPKGERQRL